MIDNLVSQTEEEGSLTDIQKSHPDQWYVLWRNADWFYMIQISFEYNLQKIHIFVISILWWFDFYMLVYQQE